MHRDTSPQLELPAFHLSEELTQQVGVAWGTPICSHWRLSLENTCRATIMTLRIEPQYRKTNFFCSPEEADTIRKRQIRMGRMARSLRDLLAKDLSPHTVHGLSVALSERFGEHGAEILPDLVIHLTVLSKVAKDCGQRGRRGRPKSNDAWDFLIESVALCYEDLTDQPAGAIWSKSSSQYDGPFLRGLVLLHDALPEDVRARSTSFLGSRAADRLKVASGAKISKGSRPSRSRPKVSTPGTKAQSDGR